MDKRGGRKVEIKIEKNILLIILGQLILFYLINDGEVL